jgi:D-3-phosphoglycerate dehydrogenase
MMTTRALTPTVLLTDYAWPDTDIERSVIEGAGFRLVAGPSTPASAEAIEALAREYNPAAIMTCWAQVSGQAVLASPNLRVVARLGVGLDNIAVDIATQVGAWVTNVPDYCVEEVSDHALAMVLAWTRGLLAYDREVRGGAWNPAGAKLRRLANLTCGILGYGFIGRRTADKLASLGTRVLVHTRSGTGFADGVEGASLDRLLRESDVVIVHLPLTEATRHLINRERLAAMKQGALLVNVSRGGVVDTKAVIDALESGHLSAAGLDVLESEPQVPPRLRVHPGAMLTPHVAFTSDASLRELRQRACEEVVRILRGESPRHPCNRPQRPPAVI